MGIINHSQCSLCKIKLSSPDVIKINVLRHMTSAPFEIVMHVVLRHVAHNKKTPEKLYPTRSRSRENAARKGSWSLHQEYFEISRG